jgi:hypothetical protein
MGLQEPPHFTKPEAKSLRKEQNKKKQKQKKVHKHGRRNNLLVTSDL